MPSDYILNVNENSFEMDVVLYSDSAPVLVNFRAAWSQPSHQLSKLLERLAHEAGGAFRVAHVNADANPNLVLRMGVRNLPTVKAFSKGGIVGEFSGVQPEALVREFIAGIHPGESDLNNERGNALYLAGDLDAAKAAFREVLALDPDSGPALLGLAKCHLSLGAYTDALAILREFPASKQYGAAERLLPLADAMAHLDQIEEHDDDDLAPLFRRAVELVGRGHPEAAADGLLEVLRQDKGYRGGLARACILGVLELMGNEHPEARETRNELNAILF